MAAMACGVLGCECGCHRQRVRRPPKLWTPRDDEVLLTRLDAGDSVAQIASALHLTVESVRWRIKQLGRSTRDGWRSRDEVRLLLGTTQRRVNRWMRDGLLVVERHGTRWTRVRLADLDAFVSAHAGVLFAVETVTDARLRRLAETSALANRRRAS